MLKHLLQYLYPATCVLCKLPGTSGQDLCDACAADLVLNHSACVRCALPLAGSSSQGLCGSCLKHPPRYDAAWSAYLYAQPLEWMIHQLKFSANLSFARLLSDRLLQMAPALSDRPDCIIPVPLHPKRLRQRGFNQAHELIKPVANSLQIPVDTHSCQRLKYTNAQTGLDARQRKKNIKNAFRFSNREQYRYIVLFDDVVTTGSTVDELSRVIKSRGVTRVDVWCLARADKLQTI